MVKCTEKISRVAVVKAADKKDFVVNEDDVLQFKSELNDLKRRFNGIVTLAEERLDKWERILLKNRN